MTPKFVVKNNTIFYIHAFQKGLCTAMFEASAGENVTKMANGLNQLEASPTIMPGT